MLQCCSADVLQSHEGIVQRKGLQKLEAIKRNITMKMTKGEYLIYDPNIWHALVHKQDIEFHFLKLRLVLSSSIWIKKEVPQPSCNKVNHV